MTDPIRAELEALIAACDEHGGMWPDHHVQALFAAVERARATLAAEPPAPAPAAYAARLRQCPTHGQLPANAWACPECLRELREGLARLRGSAVDGEREEREELATFLTKEAVAMDYWFERDTAEKVRRAAALLREARPQPVPVAAPTPDDFRRWWRETGSNDSGPTPEMLLTANAWAEAWAARCAQPIPQPPQGGEVEQ